MFGFLTALGERYGDVVRFDLGLSRYILGRLLATRRTLAVSTKRLRRARKSHTPF